MTEKFTIGLVGAPFGVKGFVKIKTFNDEKEYFRGLKEISLRLNGREKTCVFEEIGSGGDEAGFVFAKFAGIDSPEAAKTLNGAELIVPRAQAAPLKAGEFYVEDLKGLKLTARALPSAPSVENPSAEIENWEVLGHITGIIEGGGGDLVEIKLNSGETRLVPFRNEFIGDIDLAAGRAVLLERWILE